MNTVNTKENQEYEQLLIAGKNYEEAMVRLVEIIELLRVECPWDREQTHQSLRACMLEEAYEAVEAIDTGDMENLEEELGDVLLQVIFHTSLAYENNNFALCSVINRECEKMIRRHPHVFLKENAKSVDKALEKWENVKRKEQGNTTHRERLENVPKALPALIRSFKIQTKAAEVGFDWEHVSDAFFKVKEETEELLRVYQEQDKQRATEELGDLLFSVVNVARFLGINPEHALECSTDKFTRRFGFIEKAAISEGRDLDEMTLMEMDKLWDKAKALENGELGVTGTLEER